MEICLHYDANATIGQRVSVSGNRNLSVANRLHLVQTLRQRQDLGEGKLAKTVNSASRYVLDFGWLDGGTHDVRESA